MEYEYFNEAETTSVEKNEYFFNITGNVFTYNENKTKYIVSNKLTRNKASKFSADNNYYCQQIADKKYISRDEGEPDVFFSAKEYMSDPNGYFDYEYVDKKIKCDKVKIYFTSSYNAKDIADGMFAISLTTKYKDEENNEYDLVLGNFILSSFELVPTPFLVGERLYTKFIEFFVPSSYYNRTLFDNINLVTPGKINIKLSKVLKETQYPYTIDGYGNRSIKSINLIDVATVSIATVDQYTTVFAKIEEVDDYFKFEGATKNTSKTFNDFIEELPGDSTDYILMHDITINELVPTYTDDPQNWKITTHNILTQTDDFDEPVLFRPVIKYSNCVACVIDYTLRIYCQSNNTQIIKRATYQDFNFAKYGKKMIKINLGIVPPKINVYNKLDNKKISEITINNNGVNLTDEKIFKTTYITTFRDRMNIKASISPVKIDDVIE